MNTVVLYSTLVCLVIVGVVKCEIDLSEDVINCIDCNSASPSTDVHYLNKPSNPEEEILKNKCRINSHRDDAYQRLQEKLADYYVCLNTRNVTELFLNVYKGQQEINVDFYKKACKMSPICQNCSQPYLIALKECLNDKENDLIKTIQKVSHAIESFMCQNDAEHVSEFFSDGGKDCVMGRSYAIKQCVNTLKNSLSTRPEYTSFDSFMTYFNFNEEQCNDGRKLQSCILDELRQCDRPTAAYLVKSMFEIIFRNTPCTKFMKPNKME